MALVNALDGRHECLVRISLPGLDRMLLLPEGNRIVAVNFDPANETLLVKIEGPEAPLRMEGAPMEIKSVIHQSRKAEGDEIAMITAFAGLR